MTMHFRICFD